MRIALIRHLMTRGNSERRYVGRTDEPILSPAALPALCYPEAEVVIISPMLRCAQTAALIYPVTPVRVEPELREMDFGAFEYKNHRELDGDARYQAWIDSLGGLPFPGGEGRVGFTERSVRGFLRAMDALPATAQSAALVVHGGTVMALLSALGAGDYYDYQVKNGLGYTARFDREDRRIADVMPIEGSEF